MSGIHEEKKPLGGSLSIVIRFLGLTFWIATRKGNMYDNSRMFNLEQGLEIYESTSPNSFINKNILSHAHSFIYCP